MSDFFSLFLGSEVLQVELSRNPLSEMRKCEPKVLECKTWMWILMTEKKRLSCLVER